MLQSLGIDIAFVQENDPEEDLAHLYLLIDTDLTPEEGSQVSSNAKRYVIREDSNGSPSIWLPLETTLLQEGFEAAWQAGALQYLQNGTIRNGIENGWLTILDVN